MPKNNYIIIIVVILLGVFFIKPQLFSVFSIDQSKVYDDLMTPIDWKCVEDMSFFNVQGYYGGNIRSINCHSISFNLSFGRKYDWIDVYEDLFKPLLPEHLGMNYFVGYLPSVSNGILSIGKDSTSIGINIGGENFDLNKYFTWTESYQGNSHTNTITFNIEYIGALDKKSGVVRINGEEKAIVLSSSNPYIALAGVRINHDLSRGGTFKFKLKASASISGGGRGALDTYSSSYSISDLRYELPYNCDIQNDETVVRDRFIGPATINISDLSYVPIRVCVKQLPSTLRSLTEQGITSDELGTFVKDLSEGKSFTIYKDQVLDVIYITDYQEGMGERCGSLDKAYSKIKKGCIKFLTEEVDIITIIRETVFRQIGSQDILFKNEVNIGDKKITSSSPQFTCTDRSMQNQLNCFKTSVTFDRNSFEFIGGQKKDINNYFTLEYLPEATVNKEDLSIDTYSNNFILSFKNFDWFNIVPIQEQSQEESYYVLLNQKKELKFKLSNSLSNFDKSGFSVIQRKDFTGEETSDLISYPFSLTTSKELVITPDTSTLGGYILRYLPYIEIGNKKIFIPKELIYNYKVVTEFPKDIIYINQTSFIEKLVEMPVYVEKLVEVEKTVEVEKIVEVDKFIEKPVYIQQDVLQPFTKVPKKTPQILYILLGLVVIGFIYSMIKN